MHSNADYQPHHKVQPCDQEARDRIAFDKFRSAVKRPEKRCFCLLAFAPFTGLIMADGTGTDVAVNRHLLAWHAIKGEARTNLCHAGRTLVDHNKVHDQKHAKHNKPQQDRAAHHEIGKPFDHPASRICAGVPLTNNQFRRRYIQRQPQHQRREQHSRKRRKIQWPLNEKRDGEDQDRQRK